MKTGSNEKLKPLLAPMKKCWRLWSKEEEDYRGGLETYGYESSDSIQADMEYISDRWRCAFRLKWIIDGIENGSI